MRFLPVRVELSLDVTIQRPHHSYPGEHRRSAALSDQQKRFHRGLPFCGIVFGLGQFGDVGCSVAQGDQLLALGQFDRIDVPGHISPNSCANGWIKTTGCRKPARKDQGRNQKARGSERQAHDAEGAQATGEMITAIRSLGQYRCPV